MTNESHNANPKTTKPRRWFRFRLRTLLVMITLLSVPLGWVGWELDQRRREQATIVWVEEMGGSVGYDYEDATNNSTPPGPAWLREIVGIDFLSDVDQVNCSGVTALVDVSHLDTLTELRWLFLDRTSVRNLTPLATLKNLAYLSLYETPISEEDLAKLNAAQPHCLILSDVRSYNDSFLYPVNGDDFLD